MALKRAHRAIEVFDMSLMAVVTKAMAAFLVMMLILMPYYTSNPDVAKLAEELEAQWGDATDIIEKLKQAAARSEEDPKALQDMIKELETSLNQLREENDEITKLLNEARAQVQRLEDLTQEQETAAAQAQQQAEQYQKTLNSASEPSFSVMITWNACNDEDLDVHVEPVDQNDRPISSEKLPPLTPRKVKREEGKALYHWDIDTMKYQDGRFAFDWPMFNADVWTQHIAEDSDSYAVIVKRAGSSGQRSDCRVKGYYSTSVVTPKPDEAVSSYVTDVGFFHTILPAGEQMELLSYIARDPLSNRMYAEEPTDQQRAAFRSRARQLVQSSGAP